MDHPARAYVAEILVSRLGKESTRGSGYLVSPGWVLTAHHVVQDAASIGVWLGAPPELISEAGVGVDVRRVLTVAAADLALLPLCGSADDPQCEPALFGRLDRDSGPPVPVAAAGCPRFKLRPAPDRPGVLLRELDHAIGSIAPLSDAKTGRLAFVVDAEPSSDPEPDKHSPWEGMSGAAVWASDRLIGVVGQHHQREGLATLTVCPIEQLFAGTPDELEAWRTALPQLPATARNLWLAAPPTVRKIEIARARRPAEALAPQVLIGRGAELTALEAFTGSSTRWRWIQGDAFAGKTALMAWFVLHPPERVEVAACFLRRTTGQAQADYALDVLNRQLALHAGRGSYHPPTFLRERVDDFLDLLGEAASACKQRGRRLLMVIDGLDEDQTIEPGLAVARWLPDARGLPSNAWLVVASRTRAPVALAHDHPLRRYGWSLAASEAASGLRTLAEEELTDARQSSELVYPLLGLLAAAFGGLTTNELTDLLRRSHSTVTVVQVKDILSAVLKRSVQAVPDSEQSDQTMHVFAHETLLNEARVLFASDLAIYENKFDAWADSYAQSDWPSDTPRYLLGPYTRELARRARDLSAPNSRSQPDVDWPGRTWRQPGRSIGCRLTDTPPLSRLVKVVTDSRRHERMLATTGTDAAALAEILDVQQLLLDAPEPDLAALGLIAAEKYRLSLRNAYLPTQLPALWVQLGRPDRAESLTEAIIEPNRDQALAKVAAALAATGQGERAEQLARSMTKPYRRASALANVAAELAAVGEGRWAEELARTIPDPGRANALGEVAAALAAAGQRERAEPLALEVDQLAHAITDPAQTEAMLGVVAGLAAVGWWERAEQLARTIGQSHLQAHALARVAAALALAGQGDRAERLARTITTSYWQARALADVTAALAAAGHKERANELAVEVEQEARTVIDGGQFEKLDTTAAKLEAGFQSHAVADIVGALAAAGQVEGAEQLARSSQMWPLALTSVAVSLAAAGQKERAKELAAEVEQRARVIPDPCTRGDQAPILACVAAALAATGKGELAEKLIRAIAEPYWQARAGLPAVIAALAAAGHEEQAERLARAITNPGVQAEAVTGVAAALAAAGQGERAERLACTITEPYWQVQALARVAAALAAAGQEERAERLACTITEPYWQVQALARVAAALAMAGQKQRAEQLALESERLARTITVPLWQAQALGTAAVALVSAGQPELGEQLAHTIPEQYWQAEALADVAATLAAAGQGERAERLARTITEPGVQARALAGVATKMAAGPHIERAEQLAVEAERLARTYPSARRTDPVAEVVTALAAAGREERAERLARTYPDLQAQALVDVASAFAIRDSDSARAQSQRIVAELLAGNSWYQAMPVLASLAPDAASLAGMAVLSIAKLSPATEG